MAVEITEYIRFGVQLSEVAPANAQMPVAVAVEAGPYPYPRAVGRWVPYHTVPYVLRHHRAIICWVIHEYINESILHGSVRAVFIDNCMVQ